MAEKPRDWNYIFDRDPSYGNAQEITIAIGVASLIVLPLNERRRKVVFQNDSDTVIYLSRGNLAALNRGRRLNANGGAWEETPDALGYIWVGSYSAISSAANKNLLINEDR